jgi:NTP pyrophosphatase (non-canonical NTP hydrolase)
MTSEQTLAALARQVHDFVAARQWCDGHNPKNLAMAISSEVGELCEIFRWLTPEESAGVRYDADMLEATKDEIGDVLILILSLCNSLGVNPSLAVENKLLKNERRYPVSSSLGTSTLRRPQPVTYRCIRCDESN